LTYKKNFKNKTLTGAIFTILLLIMLGAYSINGLTKVFLNSTVYTVAEEQFDGSLEKGMSLMMDNYRFKFGFGFPTVGNLPIEYGEIKIKQQTRTRRKDENGDYPRE